MDSTSETTSSTRRIALLAVVAAVVLAAATPAAIAVVDAAAGSSSAASPTCETEVVYDEFRNNSEVVTKLQNNSSHTVRKSHTRVKVAKDNGFLRVTGENPNGYCVRFTVMVHKSVFPPAKLPGDVKSNDGNHTASWDSVYDWTNESIYTRITFNLSGGETATFAPSKARVYSINWVTEKPEKAQSALSDLVPDVFGDQQVEKTEYVLNASDFNRTTPFPVTVPLRHPQTGDPVEDYLMLYSTDKGKTWRVIPTTTDAPVYQEEVGNRTAVRLHFNDKDVRVKMLVNPGVVDQQSAAWATYSTSWRMTVNSVVPGEMFEVTRSKEQEAS